MIQSYSKRKKKVVSLCVIVAINLAALIGFAYSIALFGSWWHYANVPDTIDGTVSEGIDWAFIGSLYFGMILGSWVLYGRIIHASHRRMK